MKINFIRSLDHLLSISASILDQQIIWHQYQLHQITRSYVININFIIGSPWIICYQYQLHYQINRSFVINITFIRSPDHLLLILSFLGHKIICKSISTSLDHQIICYQYQLHQITRSFVINISFIRSMDHLLLILSLLDHKIICASISTSLDHQIICYQYQLHYQINRPFDININFIRSLGHLLSISASLDHLVICYQY